MDTRMHAPMHARTHAPDVLHWCPLLKRWGGKGGESCDWGLCDVNENEESEGWKEWGRSADVRKGFWLFSGRIKPVPAKALSMVLNQLRAPPPLYLLCCRWFSLSAPLRLYLLYGPCYLPPSLPCKTLRMPVCFGMVPVDTEMSTQARASDWKWQQLATKQLRTIQIIIHCGIKVRWDQLLEHVIPSSTARFAADVSSSSIFIYSLLLFLSCTWAKPSLVHLLLKSPENTTCSPLFAHKFVAPMNIKRRYRKLQSLRWPSKIVAMRSSEGEEGYRIFKNPKKVKFSFPNMLLNFVQNKLHKSPAA